MLDQFLAAFTLTDAEDSDAALALTFVEEAQAAGLLVLLRPVPAGYRIARLGGNDEAENLEVIDLDVYWTTTDSPFDSSAAEDPAKGLTVPYSSRSSVEGDLAVGLSGHLVALCRGLGRGGVGRA